MFRGNSSRNLLRGALMFALVLIAACRPPQKMADQPSYDPLEPSEFFADGMSARQPVEGTVARGQLIEDNVFTTGKVANGYATSFPSPVTREMLQRGRERFNVYCAPCHGRVGTGDGMIVMRGYRRPTSFHDARLRNEAPGYFVDVMKNGFGSMPSYATQVGAEDRWAIAAYVRALQISQSATIDDVPPEERSRLR